MARALLINRSPRLADLTDEAFEDYNHHRRHSSLGRVSPVDYERQL